MREMFYIKFRFLMFMSSCFPSLVPCLNFTLSNSPQKQVTDVSLVLKDSDMDSENIQFKRCIIYRYKIKWCTILPLR